MRFDDKGDLKKMRAEIEAALAPLAERWGARVSTGKISYDEDHFRIDVELAKVSEEGNVLNREAKYFLALAPHYGLESTDLGKTFRSRKGEMRVVGLARRSTKYPVIVEDVATGKKFKYTALATRAGLGKGEG